MTTLTTTLGPKFRTTYAVLVRPEGKGNKWVEWKPAAATFDEALETLRDAINWKGEAKIVRRVEPS
jgi:hypothetical protein